jgi:cell division protein FtsL
MEDTNLKEMVHAFAAGCLDKDEILHFINHMDSDELDTVVVGELQNVISLLPAILELEHPHPGLKDKVAKRLHKISEEIKEKRKKEVIEEPIAAQINIEQAIDFEEPSVEEKLQEEIPAKEENLDVPILDTAYEPSLIDDLHFKKLQEKIEEELAELPPLVQKEIPAKKEEEKVSIKEPRQLVQKEIVLQETKKESRTLLYIIMGLLFLFSLSAAAVIYYITEKQIQKSEKQISQLNSQVSALNNEITRLNKIQRILYILSSKDAWTINLNGTINNPTGFGKLIINYAAKDGLLQLYNMPQLSGNQSYYLWLTSKGKSYPLGSYKPTKNVEYLAINQLPDLLQADIDSFIVTIEENDGVQTPTGLQFLAVTLQNSK